MYFEKVGADALVFRWCALPAKAISIALAWSDKRKCMLLAKM